jgi:hypothetical protein
MASNRPALTDTGSRPIAVRLPNDLVALVESACAQNGLTISELIRALVTQWASGEVSLSGPSEGYTQARSMASQLAMRALQQALRELPETHEEAVTTLQGLQEDFAEQRKKPDR